MSSGLLVHLEARGDAIGPEAIGPGGGVYRKADNICCVQSPCAAMIRSSASGQRVGGTGVDLEGKESVPHRLLLCIQTRGWSWAAKASANAVGVARGIGEMAA